MSQTPKARQSSSSPEELQQRIQGNAEEDDGLPPVGEEEAARVIQSAFRRFMVRSRPKDRLPTKSRGPIARADAVVLAGKEAAVAGGAEKEFRA